MDFLEALRQPRPDPGGGAAAAYAGITATALLQKILLLETARTPTSVPSDLLDEVKRLESELRQLQQRDVDAYLNFVDLRSKKDEAGGLERATAELIDCPLEIARTAERILDIASKAGNICARHLVPDALVCCELLCACAKGAAHIARANVLMSPGAECSHISEEFRRMEIRMKQITGDLVGRSR